jgi:hypothetical protein
MESTFTIRVTHTEDVSPAVVEAWLEATLKGGDPNVPVGQTDYAGHEILALTVEPQ